MSPFEDFAYLINHVLLGEEPTIEDFILLIGTIVAFIAFILWCCFPIHPKENNVHSQQLLCKPMQHSFSTQHHNNYIKSINDTSTNYCLKSEHAYHCCT